MAVMQITVRQTYLGINVDNVLGVGTAGADDPDLLAACVEAVKNHWGTNIGDRQSNLVDRLGFDGISLTDPTLGYSTAGADGFGIGGAVMPSFVCVKVRLATGLRGRSYQGRLGLAGVLEADTQDDNGNLLKPGAQVEWNDAVTQFFVDADTELLAITGGPQLGVISQYHLGAKREPAIWTRASSVSVPSELGTRNSRKT